MARRAQAMVVQSLRTVVGLAMVLALAGCATWPDRMPATAQMQAEARVAGYGDIRIWQDADVSEWHVWRDGLVEARSQTADRGGPVSMLAISSGSDKGAYSAGFLVGWTRTGERPGFDVVSGVSTGALIAPFAFLGPDYDHVLRDLYTGIDASDIYRITPIEGLVGGPSLADTAPLEELIARYADLPLLDAIAAEHAKGRRLLVQTTNLDAERGVVWDMGAIAASGAPDRLALFRRILLASASIPGFFPPVLIDVVADGRAFREMHVDGGTTSSLFALPPAIVFSPDRSDGFAKGRLVILYNGAISPTYRTVEPRTFTIMERALTASIKEADRRSLRQLRQFAETNELALEVYAAGPEAEAEDADLFDPDYMQRLFQMGMADAERAAGADE
ncbi:patatin-like phospholipase family protein [Alteriqipengyuania lutimaris]|nr:patatin-like phospholipase family protein [Alteriqipengyuania lutimaris]